MPWNVSERIANLANLFLSWNFVASSEVHPTYCAQREMKYSESDALDRAKHRELRARIDIFLRDIKKVKNLIQVRSYLCNHATSLKNWIEQWICQVLTRWEKWVHFYQRGNAAPWLWWKIIASLTWDLWWPNLVKVSLPTLKLNIRFSYPI